MPWLPWLITTAAWPALAAQVAGTTSRLAAEPAIVGVLAVGALACAGLIRWHGRARRRSVGAYAPAAASPAPPPAAPPPGS